MKAKRKQLVVKSYNEQKETHVIDGPQGQKIQIYIGRRYGENSREINPVVCEILSVGDDISTVEVGDLLIVHHNVLTNEGQIIKVDYGEQYTILAIHFDGTVYAKINKETGELIPLNGNIIGKRIVKEVVSTLHMPFEETLDTTFDVISSPEDFQEVQPGDRIMCYKHSDYEMVYHFNNQEKKAIRIWKDDVLGIFDKVS
jgi:hypothetical protein